jgi:hypothetical protein
LALMIWLPVLPTLTVLNVAMSTLLEDVPMVLRTFVLATVAVPIVMYGLMPACIGCGSGCSSAGPAEDEEGRRRPVRADIMRSACPPSCRDR